MTKEYPTHINRIIIATTGFSKIVNFLCNFPLIKVIGILECSHVKNNCVCYANQYNIAHCFFSNFEQLRIWIISLNPDLMIVYKMPFLLPASIFEIPKAGTINIHPSLLPNYRGINPWFWIYYNMDTHSGISVHKIEQYADHGDILAQATFPIVIGDPISASQDVAETKAIDLLKNIFIYWSEIKLVPQKNMNGIQNATNHIDFEKLFDFRIIEGIRLWHILRGFPWILSKICPETKGQSYKIGLFTKSLLAENQYGNIIYSNNKIFLICKDGKIELYL